MHCHVALALLSALALSSVQSEYASKETVLCQANKLESTACRDAIVNHVNTAIGDPNNGCKELQQNINMMSMIGCTERDIYDMESVVCYMEKCDPDTYAN